MPEIRRYTVVQTREVRVVANSAVDASRVAEAAFQHGQEAFSLPVEHRPEGVWGDTESRIRETSLEIREGR